MILSRNMIVVLLLSTAVLMTGCAPNHLYRDQFELCTVSGELNCDSSSLQLHTTATGTEYLLAFVEVDDQGQLRDRAQMMAVIDTLYASAYKESLLINVFVHGWHHNASPEDSNVLDFGNSLARLSEIEQQYSVIRNRPPRKIVGVYVGWRGESITIPLINNLTFWERKSTAQEVGHSGVTELLLRLEEISNVRNTMEPPIRSRLVVVGHSFGGAVVFSATSQILASRFIDSRENKNFTDSAKGFGDLVVLLNPAFEALRYAPLYDLAQSRCSYFDTQRPRLAILTSETDYATKYAFPAGRFFSTLFETHNTVERTDCRLPITLHEGKADRTSVGHFSPLISHTLTPAPEKNAGLIADSNTIGTLWSRQKPGLSTQFGATVLTHLDHTVPMNPYMNIRVSKKIIANHNDVFGEDVMEFLRYLIVMSTWEDTPEKSDTPP